MRDTRKPINFFIERFEGQTYAVTLCIEDIYSNGNTEEQNERMILSLFNTKVRQLVLAYSLGKTKEEMTVLFLEFLDLFEKYNPDYYKNYVYGLWMVCFSYLLDIPAEKLEFFKEKVINSNRNDLLTATILKQTFNDNGTLTHVPKLNTPLNNERNSLPVSITSRTQNSNQNFYSFSLDIKCELTQEEKNNWIIKTKSLIMQAYNKKYQEYLEALAQYNAQSPKTPETTDYNNNPLKNRKIEQTELKKVAIQYMLSQSNFSVGERYHTGSSNNCYNGIIQSADLDNYAEIIKFFEEAIDWNIMDYTFHPYFWANCSNTTWQDMLKTTSNSDLLFEAFLQAGFATMRVPVRAGYEKAIMFFLDTGRIWKKGDVLVADLNEEYKSIDNSLKIRTNANCCNKPDRKAYVDESCTPKEEICIEAKWTSRVPTTLTIVQDYSARIEANGLPCFSKNDPRVKFCEDGTPLGGLNPDLIDQDAGIMVGLDNDDLAYDCNIMLQSHTNLAEAVTTITDALDAGEIDNATALPQLEAILVTLNELLADGTENSCNTAAIEATITTVEDKITEIS